MSYRSNDKTICTFYEKIGACRHGEKCSRKHVKPLTSSTILLPNLYQNPKLNKNDLEQFNPKQLQEYFDEFYKDIFIKFNQFGEIKLLVVCENDNNHLNGNVYVKFVDPQSGIDAVLDLNTCWYNKKPVHCELSPVENFVDANCRAYETDTCTRGDHCNFMHIRNPSEGLKRDLFQSQAKSALTKRLERLHRMVQQNQEAETKAAETEQPPQSAASMVEQLFS